MPATKGTVWRDATILDPDGLTEGVDIVAHDGVIASVTASGSGLIDELTVIDCQERLIVPAYINAHHHFYSAFLRGLPPLPDSPRNQRQRLERLVWPYERQLTREEVRMAVRVGLLEATLAGTTAIIDHHVSARCIDGILDVIAEEIEASGLRGILCYEITNRDGGAIARSGLRETERFLTQGGRDQSRTTGMVGLHAMSTVDDETLEQAVAIARQYDVGLHLHLGEAPFDAELSVARYGDRPVARLDRYGALDVTCLCAHAVDVSADERAVLDEHNVMVVHNPRSNASNGLGPLEIEAFQQAGITVGLGGDGFTQDIRGELPLAALLQRQGKQSPQALPPHAAIAVGMRGNAEIVGRIAGWKLGTIAPGFAADLVALAGEPTIPLNAENAAWHLAAGLPGYHVSDVYVAGRAVLREGQPVLLDGERIRAEARDATLKIWARTSKENPSATNARPLVDEAGAGA